MILHFALDMAAGAVSAAAATKAMALTICASATTTLANALAAVFQFLFIGFSNSNISYGIDGSDYWGRRSAINFTSATALVAAVKEEVTMTMR